MSQAVLGLARIGKLQSCLRVLQNELVKTRVQLSWAMKQIMKREAEKSSEKTDKKEATEAAGSHEESVEESADNHAEATATEEEAPAGGIVLDAQQEAEE